MGSFLILVAFVAFNWVIYRLMRQIERLQDELVQLTRREQNVEAGLAPEHEEEESWEPFVIDREYELEVSRQRRGQQDK